MFYSSCPGHPWELLGREVNYNSKYSLELASHELEIAYSAFMMPLSVSFTITSCINLIKHYKALDRLSFSLSFLGFVFKLAVPVRNIHCISLEGKKIIFHSYFTKLAPDSKIYEFFCSIRHLRLVPMQIGISWSSLDRKPSMAPLSRS